MASTLAEMRARLAQANNQKENNNSGYDNVVYPFWNAKTGTTTSIRFIPDGNTNNPNFWVERYNIRLPFNGILGGDPKQVTVNVPCVETWPREEYPTGCPILTEVRTWYKSSDPEIKKRADAYWKKPIYIFQGFVRDGQIEEENAPENPIRRFLLNKQLMNLVRAGILDQDMENLPIDYVNGSDFRIVKTTKGEYADYGTSSFARRESALTEAELAAIEQYGLVDLSTLLGKKPGTEELAIIKEMFEASVDGEAYDPTRWGKFYRPAGLKIDDNNESSSNNDKNNETEETTSSVETEAVTTTASTSSTSGTPKKSVSDIIRELKEKNNQAK